MRKIAAVLTILVLTANAAEAHGILIPKEKKVPPLAMLNHKVTIDIEDQVAITKVEQTFRNHTDRELEATYVFPVPKGASVRKFSMWVDGKKQSGEMLPAKSARKIYADIVRRTQDPGLLEYMDNGMLRLRIYPVPPKGDTKVLISYTSVAPQDNGVVEYVYPLKTNGKALETLEKFSINVRLKSQHSLQSIYSPSHAITTVRPNDHEAVVSFEENRAALDRDFQIYYAAGKKDVGVTTLVHRPHRDLPGYFMLLASPRAELGKEQRIPRDMVFVLDTSGSMRGKRIEQARNALKYCLSNLGEKDRFAVVQFATTVNRYADNLTTASQSQVAKAMKWVDGLEATGGTAIQEAMLTALDMRPAKASRTFTVVFFTDGQPTIGETNVEKIQEAILTKNDSNTRIFTFGVGDDVNASMLDQLAVQSRAVSTFVRERENIEVKVSGLYGKISNPVLTNLKLTVSDNVKLSEIYPPQLPDLFHGGQLVVLGQYTGDGDATVKLLGSVGDESREFTYKLAFPETTSVSKDFVEDLWARRKVGYLLDQIRINGQKKELVEEVVRLAKRYGITTPYTSYLIMPDAPVGGVITKRTTGPGGKPQVSFNLGGGGFGGNFSGPGAVPPGLVRPAEKGANKNPNATTSSPLPVADFVKQAQKKAGDGTESRGRLAEEKLRSYYDKDAKGDANILRLQDANNRFMAYRRAMKELKKGNLLDVQNGKLGVDLSCASNELRTQVRLKQRAQMWVTGRNCLEVGGVWIDENYEAKMKTVAVKAMSKAYFRILERRPDMKKVFQLGNHLVWVTPNNTALVIDSSHGREEMPDAEIDALFVAKK